MRKKESITRVSATDMRQLLEQQGGDRSDWQAARSMSQAEVERLADDEDGPLPEDWESTVQIGIPARKQAVHIRLDPDILDWFRAQGPGYQTRINAVLRAFVQSRRKSTAQAK
jgi:uncharacterized protein (DUF4415 family)